MSCLAVALNSFLFDGTTQDSDGVCYSWESIDGWFDSPDLQIGTEPRPLGVSETVIQVGGRTIALNGLIHDPNPTKALGLKCFKAMRTLKRNVGAMFVSQLLVVPEPSLSLQARVRQSAPIRCSLQGALAAVKFQIPLLAPDPRRYASTLTSDTSLSISGTSLDNQIITNNGDLVTPPLVTIVGSGTDPYIRNVSVTGSPFVQYNGVMSSDTLIIDMANLTATLNGSDVSADLSGPAVGPPAWWQLVSGAQTVRLGVASGTGTLAATVAYRDAYT